MRPNLVQNIPFILWLCSSWIYKTKTFRLHLFATNIYRLKKVFKSFTSSSQWPLVERKKTREGEGGEVGSEKGEYLFVFHGTALKTGTGSIHMLF